MGTMSRRVLAALRPCDGTQKAGRQPSPNHFPTLEESFATIFSNHKPPKAKPSAQILSHGGCWGRGCENGVEAGGPDDSPFAPMYRAVSSDGQTLQPQGRRPGIISRRSGKATVYWPHEGGRLLYECRGRWAFHGRPASTGGPPSPDPSSARAHGRPVSAPTLIR